MANKKIVEDCLKKQFIETLGYKPDIKNPQSFNEKIQWLKLNYKNSLLTKCSDKYLVRDYVAKKIGKQYLIPLLGVYDKVEDINFHKLPNKFVLKVNHGSGQNIICKNKKNLNIEETKAKLTEWMKPSSNHYYYSYEWGYKNIKPKIICEKYVEQKDKNLIDYKIYCFNGKPQFIRTFKDRFTNIKKDSFDLFWNRINLSTNKQNYNSNIKKPKNLKELIKIAKVLSNDFILVRVDLYNVDGQIYFGELTFYPAAGLYKLIPKKWDYILGNKITLPTKKYSNLDMKTLNNDYVKYLEKYLKGYAHTNRRLKQRIEQLETDLHKIKTSKTYLVWQKYNQAKTIIKSKIH